MSWRLSFDDLRLICVALSDASSKLRELDFEDISFGRSKKGTVLNIIDVCKKHDALSSLVEVLKERYGFVLAGATIGHQFPACVEQPPFRDDLVSRKDELHNLQLLLTRRAVTIVVGLGGMGKTSIATMLAREWPGPVYWHTHNMSGDQIIACALELLGVRYDRSKYTSVGSLAKLLVTSLRGQSQPWLIVIDGLDEISVDRERKLEDGELYGLLAEASKGLGNSRLLITTRVMPKQGDGEYPARYDLTVLNAEQGADLIMLYTTRRPLPHELLLEAAGPGYAKGHPLALKLLANLVDDPAAPSPAAQLQALLDDPTLWHENVALSLLDKVWQNTAADQREMIQHISVFPRPVTVPTISGMVEKLEPPSKFDQAMLDELVRRSLIEVTEDAQYDLHPLLRYYAYEKLGNTSRYCKAIASCLMQKQGASSLSCANDGMKHLSEALEQMCPDHPALREQGNEDMTFSSLLLRYTRRTGFTYEQLAEAANLPFDTILNWLKGRVRRPRNWKDVLQVARSLGLTEDEADTLLKVSGHPTLPRLRSAYSHDELLHFWPIVDLTTTTLADKNLHDVHDFVATFNQYVQRSGLTHEQLARITHLPVKTLDDWSRGLLRRYESWGSVVGAATRWLTKQPGHRDLWGDLLSVAHALNLNEGEANQLLCTAGCLDLERLRQFYREDKLLDGWSRND
ncbi:MAG: hypothetical protein DLM69_00270 [Candidatus Chloroheliales bacterium]|nr:MAG: hypothetical protein DLM69_00270 [Chloroflexota bacterium]